ncbi:hypothetical protein AYO40_00035 [Planctomycetaceae bacterium SCGC AG-212-D15]|nr:hypothetical protein AYO40_00035 [Planctomycetaceae bacterium SCGC AG-212-D15]
MTEAEWLKCREPAKMLDYVLRKSSPRRLRLFAVACPRLLWPETLEESARTLLDVAEGLADEDPVIHPLFDLRTLAYPVGIRWTIEEDAAAAAARWAHGVGLTFTPQENAARHQWVRELFGNPFRPIAMDRAWLSATVCQLSASIYVERGFERLPILADALEDAGCTAGELLKHLRQPSPHVRGCWALDLVLGKF